MKHLTSLILAAIMVAASFAGCASANNALDPQIRITSSDAESAAEWLDERLEVIPDKLVIGTEADGYGIDLSNLEDDGYFIRNLGSEVALFAKTADGLDRAVRRYAKAVEGGNHVDDVTFHEGCRVEKLTVAGNDISTYALRVEGPDRTEDVSGLRYRVENIAAPALCELIGMMCGVSLADENIAEHFIIFRPSTDPSFTDGDYRYAVVDGNLIFEYSELMGAKNAIVAFFEDQCDWKGLDAGRDLLPESDHIDIPADVDVSVDVMLDGILLPSRTFGTEYRNSAFLACPGFRSLYYTDYNSRIPHACNGWLTYRWGGYDVSNRTPCMTDPEILEAVINSIMDYVDNRMEAGAIIGYDLNYIDVAHGDTPNFCECGNCRKVYGAEGSRAGASVRFANTIAETLENEGYGGMKIITYAYMGNFAPCKTRPRDDVYITSCTHGRCINHPLDATKCTEITHPVEKIGPADIAEYTKGWGELTDNLYLWDYFLDYNYHPYVLIDQIWEDMHFMRECRVTRSYWECHTCGIGPMELQCQLVLWLNRHPDATREEYDARFRELLILHYGESWNKMWQIFSLWERAELEYRGDCLGWQFTEASDPTQMNYAYYLNECWEEILSLFDEAIRDSDSSESVRELELLKACHIYHGCYGGYFYVTETSDSEYASLLEQRYAEMLAIFEKYGITSETIEIRNEGANISLSSDLYETAAKYWDIDHPYISRTSRTILVQQFTEYAGEGTIRLPAE